MTINYFGSSGSSTFNLTSSYVILSKSGGTYDVNVTESTSEGGTASGQSVTATVLSNGTATAITFAGQTLTGLQANALFSGFMAPFAAELSSYSQLGLFTGLGNFHEAGTSQVTLGPTTMTVTNYAANSLPTTISTCEGTFTLTSYSFQTGKVPGTSITLVTLQSFKGSTVSPSYSGSIDYTLRVLSITKA